ncbi:MAG: hypothetical protein MI757_18890 [Pirellulales bacterium]|nr:hypothetical protein [Pirellulales bacterium]
MIAALEKEPECLQTDEPDDNPFRCFANNEIETEHLGDGYLCQCEIDDGRVTQDAMGHVIRAYLPHYVEFDYLLDDRDERTLAAQLADCADSVARRYQELARVLRAT